ncbi:hypothetical protein SAMN05421505_1495 [Sinosporangium album]|uniref:Uncharacterized protein n=1 Tax=Sinosporangium album TaxID=504805 RepID=A0A1G8KAC4_9ACTN|nr:hypothetical protein [Sinosporangium album]SDI40395.1 hypothetical protein SAMN05421505_1495 [Sinosporangium album]
MSMDHNSPEMPAFRGDTVEHLEKCLVEANRFADNYAAQGGMERQIARQHQERAEQYDQMAVQARRVADEWRALIDFTTARRAMAPPRRDPYPGMGGDAVMPEGQPVP